jgi:sialic acid synthase SpsE
MSKPPFIIAEAAQGYEGSSDIARLLLRAAVKAKADAIKFQVVFASDLASPGYRYYDLFRNLEMPDEVWRSLRRQADDAGIGFFIDIFGPRSLELAQTLSPDGVKLHSTTFFDDDLTRAVIKLDKPLFLSVGGIEPGEIRDFAKRHAFVGREETVLLFGYQSEPTPTDRNNLARIARLRELVGLEIGFMDHADATGPDTIALSAMALALGVCVFEKHIGLDHELELEDHVSALPPAAFSAYVAAIHRLAGALGSGDLELSPDEQGYRGRALKRVIAARDLKAGTVLAAPDITLLRPAESAGLFDPAQAVGRRLRSAVAKDQPITAEGLE